MPRPLNTKPPCERCVALGTPKPRPQHDRGLCGSCLCRAMARAGRVDRRKATPTRRGERTNPTNESWVPCAQCGTENVPKVHRGLCAVCWRAHKAAKKRLDPETKAARSLAHQAAKAAAAKVTPEVIYREARAPQRGDDCKACVEECRTPPRPAFARGLCHTHLSRERRGSTQERPGCKRYVLECDRCARLGYPPRRASDPHGYCKQCVERIRAVAGKVQKWDPDHAHRGTGPKRAAPMAPAFVVRTPLGWLWSIVGRSVDWEYREPYQVAGLLRSHPARLRIAQAWLNYERAHGTVQGAELAADWAAALRRSLDHAPARIELARRITSDQGDAVTAERQRA